MDECSVLCLVDLGGSLLAEREEVGVLLERPLDETVLLPKIGGQVRVGVLDREECSLDEVTHGLGASLRLGVDVLNTGKLQDLLGDLGSDNTSSTGRRHKAHSHGSTLASNLHGNGVRKVNHVTPVSTANRHEGQLGEDDGTTDGGGDLLGAFHTKSDVSSSVSDDDEGLETGALTSASLLLDGHDLHDFVLELREEEVDDLILLHGEREEVDFLEALDESLLHETTKLGHGLPCTFLALATISSTSATSVTVSASATASAKASVASVSTSSAASSPLID